ncbi:MAG: hypothetical protein IJ809_03615 [Clostridia bacterium]|nr:hypothetical protein [Clostridia bacterium]
MRKQGGLFQKWFTSFANAVFIQSLHAVILTFALKFLSALSTGADFRNGEKSKRG